MAPEDENRNQQRVGEDGHDCDDEFERSTDWNLPVGFQLVLVRKVLRIVLIMSIIFIVPGIVSIIVLVRIIIIAFIVSLHCAVLVVARQRIMCKYSHVIYSVSSSQNAQHAGVM